MFTTNKQTLAEFLAERKTFKKMTFGERRKLQLGSDQNRSIVEKASFKRSLKKCEVTKILNNVINLDHEIGLALILTKNQVEFIKTNKLLQNITTDRLEKFIERHTQKYLKKLEYEK